MAYTTVLQEWLRLACRSDAHPELVRRHLVTFRAMSSRLLDYVVNIADSNGNTALHYSVSHANFPVVRQLLDSGKPGQLSPRFGGLVGETWPPWSSGGDTALPLWGGGCSPACRLSVLERAAMVFGKTPALPHPHGLLCNGGHTSGTLV